MAPKPIDPLVRFNRLVDRSGECHIFTGSADRKGYGSFNRGNHRTVLAHRFAWETAHGDPGDLCVLHRCDNPPCVRIDHLFLGTVADNNADMIAKGRYVGFKYHSLHGEDHGSAKLTFAQADEIRRLYSTGLSQREIAQRFNVSSSTISLTVNGKLWVA